METKTQQIAHFNAMQSDIYTQKMIYILIPTSRNWFHVGRGGAQPFVLVGERDEEKAVA